MTLELPASPRPESPSRAPPEKPAQAALHRREKPRSARTSRGRRRPTCAARQRVRNPDGCAPTRPCAGRIAVGVLLGQVGQLRLGLPLLKCDAVLANREKVRGVMNRSDFTGGAIDQTELQLARLRIELQNTFVVFESDSCSELDAVALRGDFARHLPACHVGNDIASPGCHLAYWRVDASFLDQLAARRWRAQMVEQVDQLCVAKHYVLTKNAYKGRVGTLALGRSYMTDLFVPESCFPQKSGAKSG